jgi:hypothetical protein
MTRGVNIAGFCQTPVNIESEKQILQNEIENPTRIIEWHARYLLKALEFWTLRRSDKISEWGDEIKCALREWEVRT